VAGNLYGTTYWGSTTALIFGAGWGTVFKLTQNSDGTWRENVLHNFLDQPAANPFGAVIRDAAGNLYGTTYGGGYGTVFKLAPKPGGGWTYSVLHNFQGKPAIYPEAGLVLDKAGNLYGTTVACASGTGCYGVAFEITP